MVQWNPAAEEAFQKLKTALCTAPVLCSPDFSKPLIVETDASDTGIGAALSQEVNGEDHPVLYISRKTIPRETK